MPWRLTLVLYFVLCALRFVLCLLGEPMLNYHTLTPGKMKEQSTKFKAQSTKTNVNLHNTRYRPPLVSLERVIERLGWCDDPRLVSDSDCQDANSVIVWQRQRANACW